MADSSASRCFASTTLLVDVVVLLAQRPELAELVEHVELVRRLEQVLVIVLAVHVDQVLGHLLEHAERDRVAVEADRAAPAGVEPAGEQQFAAVGGDGDVGDLLDLPEQLGVARPRTRR